MQQLWWVCSSYGGYAAAMVGMQQLLGIEHWWSLVTVVQADLAWCFIHVSIREEGLPELCAHGAVVIGNSENFFCYDIEGFLHLKD